MFWEDINMLIRKGWWFFLTTLDDALRLYMCLFISKIIIEWNSVNQLHVGKDYGNEILLQHM
jgi:hypothetical protein